MTKMIPAGDYEKNVVEAMDKHAETKPELRYWRKAIVLRTLRNAALAVAGVFLIRKALGGV